MGLNFTWSCIRYCGPWEELNPLTLAKSTLFTLFLNSSIYPSFFLWFLKKLINLVLIECEESEIIVVQESPEEGR